MTELIGERFIYQAHGTSTIVIRLETGWYVSKTINGTATHAVVVMDQLHVLSPELFKEGMECAT